MRSAATWGAAPRLTCAVVGSLKAPPACGSATARSRQEQHPDIRPRPLITAFRQWRFRARLNVRSRGHLPTAHLPLTARSRLVAFARKSVTEAGFAIA